MACASSQREGGRIGQGGRIHYFNYSFGYQDTKVRALGGDIIIGIICVLRPWFDCIDRHAYLLGFPLRAANGRIGQGGRAREIHRITPSASISLSLPWPRQPKPTRVLIL